MSALPQKALVFESTQILGQNIKFNAWLSMCKIRFADEAEGVLLLPSIVAGATAGVTLVLSLARRSALPA